MIAMITWPFAASASPLSTAATPVVAQHGPGHPQISPPAQLQAQLEDVRKATARFRDHEVAFREGYRLFGQDGPLMGEHWYHPGLVLRPFDLERPSTLMYMKLNGVRTLIAVAYTIYRRPDEPMPEGFAGDADRWHVHDIEKITRVLMETHPMLEWIGEHLIRQGKVGGGQGRTHLTMLHTWVWIENPDGVFADHNRALAYLRLGLPASYANGGTMAAAKALGLAVPNGCAIHLSGLKWIAGLYPDQETSIQEACDEAVAGVRSAIDAKLPPGRLNLSAFIVWRQFEAAQNRILTERQKARLAAMTDHALPIR